MLIAAIVRLVDLCRRHAGAIATMGLVGVILLAVFTAERLGINTDSERLISAELPWRQRNMDFDRAFPQTLDLLVIVIDAPTADRADRAATALGERLRARPDLFRSVRQPGGEPFFRRNGLLFLSTEEVAAVTDRLIEAQPLLASVAADPSLRGVFAALDLALRGVEHDERSLDSLDAPLSAVAMTIETALNGRPQPLDWAGLVTRDVEDMAPTRRFLLVRPVLDYEALSPGAQATGAVRAAARDLDPDIANDVRVRLTGPVALTDEEFATVAENAGLATLASLGLVFLLLLIAVRSIRVIASILATLLTGLVATSAFAAAAVGTLNLISVAFAVLFVGIAVDFGIQVGIRYRDERHRADTPAEAMRRTAAGLAGPLVLAATTTAVGFASFIPTAYRGVSELGLIAGTGMLIALVLNLTLLPALLTLTGAKGAAAPMGFAWAAPVERFLIDNRRTVVVTSAVLTLAALAALPFLRFDFNPLNLRDPETESVSTLLDLTADPQTSPDTLNILAPSMDEAGRLARALQALPEVAGTVTLESFVPDEQDEKLALIEDARFLLEPTLDVEPSEPPDADAVRAAMADVGARLRALAPPDEPEAPARRLAALLDRAATAGPDVPDALDAALVPGFIWYLDTIRTLLRAERITPDTLPDHLVRDWMAPDGRVRIEVFPSGDTTRNEVLADFVAAVRSVAPEVTGNPVSILESGRTIVRAFVTAAAIALIAIAVILAMVLRDARAVILVIAPLALSMLLTLATSAAIGPAINFANIIALPLLLGIGVAYGIYFVINRRSGLSGLLASPTARAILFSALTTATAFGGLGLSSHPGTASMGALLMIALFWTLATTLLFLPALLSYAYPSEDRGSASDERRIHPDADAPPR